MLLSRIWGSILVLLLTIGLAVSAPADSVVLASEVMAKIKAGEPAEFDNCIVEGELNLSSLKIEEPVHFNYTLFQNSVNFKSTIFNGDAYFVGSTYNGDADFSFSTYNGTAYFLGSTYNGNAYFVGSTYNGDADFSFSTYNGTAYFYESTYKGDAGISFSTYNGTAYFYGSTYKRYASFSNSTYKGDAGFLGSTYNGTAYFYGSTYKGFTVFSGSTYNGTAYFLSSTYKGFTSFSESIYESDADFWGSTYNYASFLKSTYKSDADFSRSTYNYADFSDSTYESDADFSCSTYNRTAYFADDTYDKEANLNDALFKGYVSFNSSQFKGDALFENTTIEGKLFLTKTRYDRLYIRWLNIKGGLIYDDAAYMSLMKNFKALGYFEDADKCYYKFRVEQFLHRNYIRDPTISLLDLGAWIFYGFSKKPLFPVLWSIFLVVLFGFSWMGMASKERESAIRRRSMVWVLLFMVFFGVFCLWIAVDFPTLLGLILILSIFFVALLEVFSRVMKLNKLEGSIDDYITTKNWFEDMSDALSFSATVFLSGTKLFVDPPAVPMLQGISTSFIKKMFVIERLLGALFSILFFLALTGMVIKPV